MDGKEDAMITGEDDVNRAILLKKLLAMEGSAKRKRRNKVWMQETSVLQSLLISEFC